MSVHPRTLRPRHEEHVGVDAALLEAGNHGGATHHQLQAFARAALRGQPAAVGLRDGSCRSVE